jgi:hypothetical protein
MSPIAVAAGHHEVICDQDGLNTWSKPAEVPAGKTVVVEGFMLALVKITLAVDATIDGVPYRADTVVPLKKGRHDVNAGGSREWITVRGSCTLRTSPSLGWY